MRPLRLLGLTLGLLPLAAHASHHEHGVTTAVLDSLHSIEDSVFADDDDDAMGGTVERVALALHKLREREVRLAKRRTTTTTTTNSNNNNNNNNDSDDEGEEGGDDGMDGDGVVSTTTTTTTTTAGGLAGTAIGRSCAECERFVPLMRMLVEDKHPTGDREAEAELCARLHAEFRDGCRLLVEQHGLATVETIARQSADDLCHFLVQCHQAFKVIEDDVVHSDGQPSTLDDVMDRVDLAPAVMRGLHITRRQAATMLAQSSSISDAADARREGKESVMNTGLTPFTKDELMKKMEEKVAENKLAAATSAAFVNQEQAVSRAQMTDAASSRNEMTEDLNSVEADAGETFREIDAEEAGTSAPCGDDDDVDCVMFNVDNAMPGASGVPHEQ